MIETTTNAMIDTPTNEYLSLKETARRMSVSLRHIERVVACNDHKKIGVGRVGRRCVRVHFPTFHRAFMAGTLRS